MTFNIEPPKTSAQGGADTISLELNEHEQLIIRAHCVKVACDNIMTYIASVCTRLSALSNQGVFQKYLANDQDLMHYVTKAQDLQVLATIFHDYCWEVHDTFVATDQLLALELVNYTINNGIPRTLEMNPEDRQKLIEGMESVIDHPQYFYNHMLKEVKKVK